MTRSIDSAPICFIGGGNMASSLIGGLIKGGHPASLITVVDPGAEPRERLRAEFEVNTAEHLDGTAPTGAVVIAVKPHIVESACATLAPQLGGDCVVVSVAAGTRSTDIDRWLGGDRHVVRCMPNTPALYGEGASVLFANDSVSPEQRNLAEFILAAGGKTWWVDFEPQLDAVTALSGSGPAYGFLLIEAMADAGRALGLDAELAEQLAVQTLLGAATMATHDPRSPATLREGVTSKGGTTAAALNAFESGGFRNLVATAMTAARDRAQELAEPNGDTP